MLRKVTLWNLSATTKKKAKKKALVAMVMNCIEEKENLYLFNIDGKDGLGIVNNPIDTVSLFAALHHVTKTAVCSIF